MPPRRRQSRESYALKSAPEKALDAALESFGLLGRQRLERSVTRMQEQFRELLHRKRLRSSEIQKRVADLRSSRGPASEHLVDVQKLTFAMEGLASLGGHATYASLFHAVEVLLTDTFNCTSTACYRIVETGGAIGKLCFQLGEDMRIPLHVLPIAHKLLTASASIGGCFASESDASGGDGALAEVASCAIDATALSELRVVAWVEPAVELSNFGRPEALVGAGHGEDSVYKACEELRRSRGRSNTSARPAEAEDACFVSAIRIGSGGSANMTSLPEAIVLLSRVDAPLSPEEIFLAARLGAHIGIALRAVETRISMREASASKAALLAAVPEMAKGEKAVERFARGLLECDDAVLFLVQPDDRGRPELVPATRDGSRVDGLYEHVEHFSVSAASNAVLNLKQGSAGTLERLLETLPSSLRGHSRSMLCVPILIPRSSNSVLSEGPVGVMTWRNAAAGAFSPNDVRLASEWAALASPSLQLAATQSHRLILEDRVALLSAKRDALLASALLLGSTRSAEMLFTETMIHAKSLMEVERSTM